jgi:IS1 family transposase
MRKLSVDQRAAILGCLIEGMSIRATCRITGAAKVTVLRLLADAANVCTEHHDRVVQNLATERVQCDEAWSFVGCKDKAKRKGAEGYGSAWVWVAQDADSKLIVTWVVGQRDMAHSDAFMFDLAERVEPNVQISTDAFAAYPASVRAAFPNASHGVVSKVYAMPQKEDVRRYSPSVCVGCTKTEAQGSPDPAHISTSYIERQNRDLRMRCRRLTRLTDAFSKKIENHVCAVALHYWAFNFVKKHATIKTTPAVAAGIADRPLTTLDLAVMIEREEAKHGGRRITSYLPAAK